MKKVHSPTSREPNWGGEGSSNHWCIITIFQINENSAVPENIQPHPIESHWLLQRDGRGT